ncbi:MAG TPA: multidrug effflux MFS transporter [Candidatus Acidoferrum sp.]|nr:multidrug effflux MFS transporter [Candidatus Acidoferrum sp.]
MDHTAPSAALRASLPLPLLSAIAALPPLAVDMYLPAMPQIAGDFHTSLNTIQNSLSIFLLGFGLGMLFWGPMADKYGRRPLALFGLAAFGIVSLLLTLSGSAIQFLTLRLLQGLLGSAATVTVPAMIRDCFGKDTAKGMSTVQIIMLIAPLIAPVIGSTLLALGPWQYLFAFLTLYPAVLVTIVWRVLPETKAPAQTAITHSPLRNYQLIFGNHRIYWDLFTYVCIALAWFTYITGVSFIYITWFGVSETVFGYLFACSAAALVIANLTNRRFVSHKGPRWMQQRSLAGAVVIALLIAVGTWLKMNVALTVFGFFCLVGCLGITWVNTDALILIEFPHHAGSAAGVIGTTRFGVGALAGPVLAWIYTGTILPVMTFIFVMIAGACVLQAVRYFVFFKKSE